MIRAFVLLPFTIAAFGQDARFLMASIRIAAKMPSSDMRVADNQVEFRNYSLAALVEAAYQVQSYQVAGPEWMAAQHFDIDAKMPPGSEEKLPEMLRALLADRFKLVVRREAKEQSAYALIVGKGGAKLKEADPGGGQLDLPLPKDRTLVYRERTTDGMRTISEANRHLRLDADKISMPELALFLFKFVDAPVVDRTELKGYYQVSFEVPPPKGASLTDAALLDRSDQSAERSVVSIFVAVQMLGLKMEKRKMAIERVVIEHIEKIPSGS